MEVAVGHLYGRGERESGVENTALLGIQPRGRALFQPGQNSILSTKAKQNADQPSSVPPSFPSFHLLDVLCLVVMSSSESTCLRKYQELYMNLKHLPPTLIIPITHYLNSLIPSKVFFIMFQILHQFMCEYFSFLKDKLYLYKREQVRHN